jgi:hypothetical protein
MKTIKHGHASTNNSGASPEYKSWTAMKQRCLNPKNTSYTYYGGRGIKICDRWILSFMDFLKDMGPRPPNKTLDRIDNDGNYCPENCRWATNKEQCANKRPIHGITITANGKTQSLILWAKETGISYSVLNMRITRGWPSEDVIGIPLGNKGSRYQVKKDIGEIKPPSIQELEELKVVISVGAVSFENQCKIIKAFDELIKFRNQNQG